MTRGHVVLTIGLLVLLGIGLVGSAGLAQEQPGENPAAAGCALIGMAFLPFLWLLIVAAVISLLMYFLLGVKLMGGPATNILVGWIGAWLGSPVFGHWFKVLSAHGVYFIPAILGCAGLLYGCHCCQQVTAQAQGKPLQST